MRLEGRKPADGARPQDLATGRCDQGELPFEDDAELRIEAHVLPRGGAGREDEQRHADRLVVDDDLLLDTGAGRTARRLRRRRPRKEQSRDKGHGDVMPRGQPAPVRAHGADSTGSPRRSQAGNPSASTITFRWPASRSAR